MDLNLTHPFQSLGPSTGGELPTIHIHQIDPPMHVSTRADLLPSSSFKWTLSPLTDPWRLDIPAGEGERARSVRKWKPDIQPERHYEMRNAVGIHLEWFTIHVRCLTDRDVYQCPTPTKRGKLTADILQWHCTEKFLFPCQKACNVVTSPCLVVTDKDCLQANEEESGVACLA